MLRPLQHAARIPGLAERVTAPLTQGQRPAPPRTGVGGVTATGREAINPNVGTAAERAASHNPSLGYRAPVSKGPVSPVRVNIGYEPLLLR